MNCSPPGSSGQDIDLDYHDIQWFALEMNRDHSVVFEIAPKYCISDSFVDYDGYSISSKGFLPTIVSIMVNWLKFTHSSPFYFIIYVCPGFKILYLFMSSIKEETINIVNSDFFTENLQLNDLHELIDI